MKLDIITKELKQNVDKEYKKGCENYFKEKIDCLGVRTPVVRKIAKKHYLKIKDLSKKDLFHLCEQFFKTNINEHATIATQWLSKKVNIFDERDVVYLEKIINKYLNNWAKIDDFCTHVVNRHLQRYPSCLKHTITWTTSKNLWVRRASAVSLITRSEKFYSKKNLSHIFRIAKLLMDDKQDLVQKGYGWMLKVASDYRQKEVFMFVIKHKKNMSRTSLRYAIEKMPVSYKKKAMG